MLLSSVFALPALHSELNALKSTIALRSACYDIKSNIYQSILDTEPVNSIGLVHDTERIFCSSITQTADLQHLLGYLDNADGLNGYTKSLLHSLDMLSSTSSSESTSSGSSSIAHW